MNPNDTIFALATAHGRSGVAVIRVSGAAAAECFGAFGVKTPATRMATLATLKHPETRTEIDASLLLYFPAPNSFTGEEVVEIHCHGGKAVIETLLAALTTLPHFRPAAAGEFTRRAVEHGKMDIMQAEGLADLIDAQTMEQQSQALMQMGGYPSEKYHEIREKIIHSLALLEAYIDFPDEPVPESVLKEVHADIDGLKSLIQSLLNDHKRGQLIRDGVHIAIIGPPNAGKSTLMNWLAGRDVAIVSDIAGTTRDTLETSLNINGVLVNLVDTAGLRESDDTIEAEGIRRAKRKAEEADMVVMVLDGSATSGIPEEFEAYTHKPHFILMNKADIQEPSLRSGNPDAAAYLSVSLKKETGTDIFMAQLEERLSRFLSTSEPALITRARHRTALETALTYLNRFAAPTELELMCEELRLASDAIATITGAISTDDLLDVIFSSFCIGK